VLGLVAVVAVAVVAVSGRSGADPRTPPALPGLAAPFLGTAVVGSGGVTAAVDSYGDVVDLRAPGPAGRGLIYNPADRQAAGSVPSDTGIVPRVSVGGGAALPLWRARSIRQSYLRGTNVLRTVAQIDGARVEIVYAARGRSLGCLTQVRGARAAAIRVGRVHDALRGRPAMYCDDAVARRIVRGALAGDRRWVARARALGSGAPGWARRMYVRSLLVLRALTDRRSGAVAAGARDGWAYVWPRDAGAVAIALASAGYRDEARRVVRFLLGLHLESAARFHGDGTPVGGRGAEGDAAGWVEAAARAAGLPATPTGARGDSGGAAQSIGRRSWSNRADYQEGEAGDYLANAIASGVGAARIRALFGIPGGLERRAGDPGSGLDSAAAWAVRPFPRPALFPLVRRSLRRLLASQGRFGIVPAEDWPDGEPWTAPTAWTAWSFAALGERRQALRLLADLRRAATPAGLLPERVGARTGIPRSTTPLAWSHAFVILALRQLWPGHKGRA
jgi:glucoamylase